MDQFDEIKSSHPDSILFFRMGDFYELFHDDAEIASEVLGLTLTSRDKKPQTQPAWRDSLGMPWKKIFGAC